MLLENPILRRTVEVSAAIKSGHCVTYAGALAVADSADILGPLYMDAAAKENATATILGTARCIAGAAIAVGAKLSTDVNGRAVTRTSTNPVFGRALSAAAADGDEVEVFLIPS